MLSRSSSGTLKPNLLNKASLCDIETSSENKDVKNRTVINGKKLFITPAKKKIVINPKLSPIEKIREQNIAERMALLIKLGFCNDKKLVKTKAKIVKSKQSPKKSVRKSQRIKNTVNPA